MPSFKTAAIVGFLLVSGLTPARAADDELVPRPGHLELPVAPPERPVSRRDQPRSWSAEVALNGFRSIQVNVDALQNNIVGDAANESTIAVDPTDPDNIVIAWRQFDTIASDFRQAGVAYSHDGGETWTFDGPLDPGQFRSDPVLVADSLGNFYYYSLSSVTTGEYFISVDKGVSWTSPIASPAGDKNWHAVDASGGAGDGHLYPIWNSQFTCCAPGTDFSRSTDGAVFFEGPYSLPVKPKWGTNAVGPDGELYIVGAQLSGVGHLILRSDNADDDQAVPSFPLAQPIDLGGNTTSGGAPNPGGLLGQVWVDVDRSGGAGDGYVYVLASVVPPGGDPLDVHLIRSLDGGVNWSAPLRVNDDPIGNGAYQWFGTMSVAPNGRIDVVWNDTRGGTATISQLYYAYSINQGVSFSSGIPVSPPFDSTLGHPQQNKIGDYYQMVSDLAGAGVAYAATFNGEQDVYYVRVGDCNENGFHDARDLFLMTSADVNANGIPDECEADCNLNGLPDSVDLERGTSFDCNGNAQPDECDIAGGASADCDANGTLDECQTTLDLESAQGFSVGDVDDTATTGIWVRVDPNGTAAQPENDHSAAPGSDCFVTGQGTVGGGLGEQDVDGGKTSLFSPSFDLSGATEPWIGYWRWYSNATGGAPNADSFLVDISNDGGGNWSSVEVVGPSGPGTSGGWNFHSFRVADILPPTADVRLRFTASDLGSGSIVEAAIDDLLLIECAACAASIPAEVANVRLSISGNDATLNWDPQLGVESFAVYRGMLGNASDLGCFQNGIAATSTQDDGLIPPSGEVLYHVVTAVNCAGESVLGFDRTVSLPCP